MSLEDQSKGLIESFTRRRGGLVVTRSEIQHEHQYSQDEYSLSNSRRHGGGWDPMVPYVISLYFQVFLNVLVCFCAGYILYVVGQSISTEVRFKIDKYQHDAATDIAGCQREYERNRCGSAQQAPILDSQCHSWRKCMSRDPNRLGHARISAEALADIVNGFFRPLSWKALLFMNAIVGVIGLVNHGLLKMRQDPVRGYEKSMITM